MACGVLVPVLVRCRVLLLSLVAAGLPGATLERLSLEEMVEKSTAVVRARVAGSYTAAQGGIIYTHYRVQVLERWKGHEQPSEDVMTPGGIFNGVRQTFSGAPRLTYGREYVLFLWKGKSGGTHLIGLTQGLFSLPKNARPDSLAVREESSENMLDAETGRAVRDERVEIRLSDLSARIRRALGGETR